MKPIVLMRMESAPASQFISDRCMDLVYIDAGHSYEFLAEDIRCWVPKVRIGGIICGHDWDPTGGFPGVVQAVEEAFPHYNLSADTGAPDNNHVWWLQVTEEVVEFVDQWAHGKTTSKQFDIRRLFGSCMECSDDLDNGMLSQGLLQGFESEGVVLSDAAAVVADRPGSSWLVVDNGTKYYITKGEDELSVYNIEKIEPSSASSDASAVGMEKFFEPYPLLQGFSQSWAWAKDVNHANPFYSPLYYNVCRSTGAKHILEIGCEQGYSSWMLATAAQENGGVYYCIEKSSAMVQQLRGGLIEEGFPHVLIWADSKDVKEFPWAPRLDFVLFDGDHSVEAIQAGFEMLYPKLAPGGYVALHDIYAWSAEGFYELIHNPAYDFEYVTFQNNYGLALLRKRLDDWEKTLVDIANDESNKEPSVGWMYAGAAPADSGVVVVSTTIPEIETHSMEEASTEQPQESEETKPGEEVLKIIVPTAAEVSVEEVREPQKVPENLQNYVQRVLRGPPTELRRRS